MSKISVLAMTKSTGGIALYNRMLLNALDSARFDTHTLCLSENGADYAKDLSAQGLNAEPVAMARYSIDPRGDLRVLRRVLAITRQRRIDLLLCHGSKAGFIGRAAGRIAGIPAIYCQASLPFLRRVQGGKAPLYWALELAARSFGGQIVTLTEGARRATLAHRLASADRVTVIRTGIDTDRFRPRGRHDQLVAELGLDPARPVVGWLGRLEPQKAPQDYVAALELVAPRHPEAQFIIAGEGRMRPEISRRLAETNLIKRVLLLPWQTNPSRILEAFDIYALSSRWEGLPLTLLEAMASGCAPVSTDVDGCSEVIENGVSGRLVSASDPAGMAAALDDLLSAPDRQRAMAEAARRRVELQFDRRQMVARWTELLERLAAHEPVSDLAESG